MRKFGERCCILLFLNLAFYMPLTFGASAQDLPLDARLRVFEAWVENLMEERSLPSISLAVVSGQELVYARAFAEEASSRGLRLVVPHFRGCSGELNRLPRAYHSGDIDEIDWMMRVVAGQSHGQPLFALGVSLGGNALMAWAGRRLPETH
ncbi:MAG: hypothetical protein EBY45_15825, partial [Gammaproteobacteria bacterium]|nr:hypothetical protein [Gammaproteobacteria bacterium]